MATRRSVSGGGQRGMRRGGRMKAPAWLSAAVVAVLGGWFVLQPPARREEVSRLVQNSFERDKRVEVLDVAWDIYRLYYGQDFVGAVATGDKTHAYGGLPRATQLPWTVRTLMNRGYAVGYAEAVGGPVWAAYRVADLDSWREPAPRPDAFVMDARTVMRVEPSVYTNSGYDRGHLAPNYAIATRYGEAAQRETFLMSNITPQRHALNAGLWKQLELKIATSYPARFGEVWVLAGPIFAKKPTRLRGGVEVPEAFFMIVVDESDGRVRAQAFVLPQDAPVGGELGRYLTSIDEIERRTGLDVLEGLEDGAEAILEAKTAERVW
jgi:endonuclease G, mitochondrial